MYVEYKSNNSGGTWWLNDDDWKKLAVAGWKVVWGHLEYLYTDKRYVNDEDGTPTLVPIGEGNCKWLSSSKQLDGDYRFLGALATTAFRIGLSLREAVSEWEKITGKCSTEAGCPCCGPPHHFMEYDDSGKCVESGPETSYEAHW